MTRQSFHKRAAKPPSSDSLSMRAFDKREKHEDNFVLKAFANEEGQPDSFVMRAFDRFSKSDFSSRAFDSYDRETGKPTETRAVLSVRIPPHMRKADVLKAVVARLPVGSRAGMSGSMLMTVECDKREVGNATDVLGSSGLHWQEE